MSKNILLILLVVSLSFLGGSSSLQHELDLLKQHGCTYRFLGSDQIEIRQDWSGFKRVKTLTEPSGASIRAWAAARNVPILEIDPSMLDTSRWSGWFRYWTTLPLSNTFGVPLQVADLDNNGIPEVYGIYKSYSSDFESAIYETDSVYGYIRRYTYLPYTGGTMAFANIDRDSLREIIWELGSYDFDFEQAAPNALPIRAKLRSTRDSANISPLTGIYLGALDGNGETDFLHTCSIGTLGRGVCVDAYVPSENRFSQVWVSEFEEHGIGNYGGFAVGDFDDDGRMEFSCAELSGKVYVVKSTGVHSYATVYRDSTPFVNLFYTAAGDIDDDGRPEFFVGATMSNGNWTTVYEADSIDHYSPHFIFHLLSGGSLNEPTYLVKDIDHDERLELIILSGADLYVFKSDAHDSYYLWYYKHFVADESIQFYDFNNDGKDDFILSRSYVNPQGNGALFADIYLAQRFTGVTPNTMPVPTGLSLWQNYPNPFNPVTGIEFSVAEKGRVTLSVFDLNGRHVITLLDDEMAAGSYNKSWDGVDGRGNSVASGIYLCRLIAGSHSLTIKMALIR